MVEQNTVNICIDVRFILRALNESHLKYIKNIIFIFDEYKFEIFNRKKYKFICISIYNIINYKLNFVLLFNK